MLEIEPETRTVSEILSGYQRIRKQFQAPAPRRQAVQPVAKPEPVKPVLAKAPALSDPFKLRLPADPHWTFASFMVGDSNRMAYAAARQVAGSISETAYNPLFIHGPAGVGKSRLLHAIANEAGAEGVMHITASRFMYAFVGVMRDRKISEFRYEFRNVRLFIVDDLQAIQGRSVLAEFAYLIEAMVETGRQVVVSADRTPDQLDSMGDRTRSRLAGGLVVGIEPIDRKLRQSIVDALAAGMAEKNPLFSVAEKVLDFIVENCAPNGRSLEGAMNRVLAMALMTGQPVTMDQAEPMLRDICQPPERRPVRIDDIIQVVAKHYNVTRADILSQRRTANVVRPRQVAMYLAKTLTLRSLPEVGRRFGGRDHTTVLHGVRKISAAKVDDRELSRQIAEITAILEAGS